MPTTTITMFVGRSFELSHAQLAQYMAAPEALWGNLELAIHFNNSSLTLSWTGFTKGWPEQPQCFAVLLGLASEKSLLTVRKAQEQEERSIRLYDGGAEPFSLSSCNLLSAEEAVEVAWHFGTTGEPLTEGSRRFDWVKTPVVHADNHSLAGGGNDAELAYDPAEPVSEHRNLEECDGHWVYHRFGNGGHCHDGPIRREHATGPRWQAISRMFICAEDLDTVAESPIAALRALQCAFDDHEAGPGAESLQRLLHNHPRLETLVLDARVVVQLSIEALQLNTLVVEINQLLLQDVSAEEETELADAAKAWVQMHWTLSPSCEVRIEWEWDIRTNAPPV